MVKHTMQVNIEYPEQIACTGYQLHQTVKQILQYHMNLLTKSTIGNDILPTEVSVTWMNAWTEAYKSEVQYQFEESEMYDEDDPEYNIKLTEEDYEEIANDVCNNDWLNEQIGDVVRDAVRDHIRGKMRDDDNNE